MNRLAAAVAAKKAAALLPKPAPVAAPEERPLPEMGPDPRRHKDRSKPKKPKEPKEPAPPPPPRVKKEKVKKPFLSDADYEAIKNGDHPQRKLQEASRVWFVTPEQFKGLPKADRSLRKFKPSPDDRGRLPNDSGFHCHWIDGKWKLRLTVPGAEFVGEFDTLFKGQHVLDKQFRAWFATQPQPATPEEPCEQVQNPLEMGCPVA